MATTDDAVNLLLEKVRKQMFDRGLVSCGTIVRACKRADWNSNGKLDKAEFDECLKSVGVYLGTAEIGLLFRRFDITGDGNITYDEFLTALRVRAGRAMFLDFSVCVTVGAFSVCCGGRGM